MYTHTLTSICGALILAGVATVIGFEGIATASKGENRPRGRISPRLTQEV